MSHICGTDWLVVGEADLDLLLAAPESAWVSYFMSGGGGDGLACAAPPFLVGLVRPLADIGVIGDLEY